MTLRPALPLSGRSWSVLAIILVAGIAALYAVLNLRFQSWDFRNNLWAPAYLLVRGQSPYEIRGLFPDSNAIWLPMAIGLFFPLGWLSEQHASNVWLLLNCGVVVGLVWTAAGQQRPNLLVLGAALVAAFLFLPTLTHLVLGQFSLLTTLAAVWAARAVKAQREWTAAFLIALCLVKPQLSVVFLPGLLLSMFRRSGLGTAARLLGLVIVWIAATTVPLMLANPDWMLDLRNNFARNETWLQPSAYSLLQFHFGTAGFWAWVLMLAAALDLSAWRWLRHDPEQAMRWSLALTPLVSPYIWSWDFVLQLPLFVHAAFTLQTWPARLILWLGIGLIGTGSLALQLSGQFANDRYWWISWAVMAAIAASYGVERLRQRAA